MPADKKQENVKVSAAKCSDKNSVRVVFRLSCQKGFGTEADPIEELKHHWFRGYLGFPRESLRLYYFLSL